MPARVEEANNNMLGGDDDRDAFDWEEIVHEAETAEDDSSDFDPEEEEPPSDDDDLSEYISDDESAEEDWEDGCEMIPRGTFKVRTLINLGLSENSKALLFWRDEENGKYFSDWKINIEADKSDCDDCSEETTVTVYDVHRLVLAMGPQKSGYFEALFQSGCYSESSNRVSTVKLPEMAAKQFPDFLDYLYAQPQDSYAVINFENWESMKYLADYFLVPRLTEDVAQFIERDMEKNFNKFHMEKYISEFHRDISSDMSRRILPMAVRTCAEMFQSIEVDSSLLIPSHRQCFDQ